MYITLKHFYNKRIAFFLLVLFILVCSSTIVGFEKDVLHLYINKFHSPFWDVFFKYITYIGDGIVFPIVIAGLLLFKRKYTVAFIYAGVLTLILSYISKHYIFLNNPRPFEVFGNRLHLIDGVKMRRWLSFPSGHTTAAFSLAILAVLYTKKKRWEIVFLTLAILAGFSRIYLSQHFLQDVMGGAILGSGIALLAFHLDLSYSFFKK